MSPRMFAVYSSLWPERTRSPTIAPRDKQLVFIVDIAPPPTGGAIDIFNTYVALSRSSGRDTIRLLREFKEESFFNPGNYPESLQIEDERLERLNELTKQWWDEVNANLAGAWPRIVRNVVIRKGKCISLAKKTAAEFNLKNRIVHECFLKSGSVQYLRKIMNERKTNWNHW